jgi:hypothetical protein
MLMTSGSLLAIALGWSRVPFFLYFIFACFFLLLSFAFPFSFFFSCPPYFAAASYCIFPEDGVFVFFIPVLKRPGVYMRISFFGNTISLQRPQLGTSTSGGWFLGGLGAGARGGLAI